MMNSNESDVEDSINGEKREKKGCAGNGPTTESYVRVRREHMMWLPEKEVEQQSSVKPVEFL